jgi:hypothetical protein
MSEEEEVCLLVTSFTFVDLCLEAKEMSVLHPDTEEARHTDLAEERGSGSQPIS